jgi:DNA-binding GntR family transcriptional regulator
LLGVEHGPEIEENKEECTITDHESMAELNEKVRRVSLADQVAAALRESICEGRLEPGDRLVEQELADLMDVSRGPVREALTQLEQEYIIKRVPYRDSVVADISDHDCDEIYSLSMHLEAVSAHRACRNIADEDIAQLEDVLENMVEAVKQDDIRAVAQADLRFHDIIFRCAAHGRLLDIWQRLRAQIYLIVSRKLLSAFSNMDEFLQHHRRQMNYLRKRDAEGVWRYIAGRYLPMVERFDELRSEGSK